MRHLLTYSVIVFFAAAAPSTAGVVVDHPSVGVIAPGSDTAFINSDGQEVWQLLADDLVLDNPFAVPIHHASWVGAYDLDNAPDTETMRIRFYDARPVDGLPGNVLFEESFTSAIRSETGNLILTSVIAREFIYEANFSTPFILEPNITYWLEIAQIGDLSSNFRMEQSLAETNGFAFQNGNVSDWTPTAPIFISDLAFQLSTIPEPSSLTLFAVCFGVLATRRGRKGVRGG